MRDGWHEEKVEISKGYFENVYTIQQCPVCESSLKIHEAKGYLLAVIKCSNDCGWTHYIEE